MTIVKPIPQNEILPFGGIAGISIVAFTELAETSEIIGKCRESRHMMDVKFRQSDGGIEAAIRAFREAQSPHVLIIETQLAGDALMSALDRLAEVCEADTRLILIGNANDVMLYRDLVRRGVSEYIPQPVTVRQVIRAIAEIEELPGGLAKGRVIAFTGASGGCGSSTMAASAAWLIGHRKSAQTTLVDLDIEFGSIALNLGLNPLRGVSDALRAGLRLDSQYLEGILQDYDEYLRVLPASEQSIDEPDFSDEAIDQLVDVARSAASYVILDVPQLRTASAQRAVMNSDQIFVTATPDLASLRNAKKLIDTFRRARPEESEPFLLINKVGAAKRYEVPVSDFVDALSVKRYAVINYEPSIIANAAAQGKSVLQMDRGKALLSDLNEMIQDIVGSPVTTRNGLFNTLFRRIRVPKRSRK